MSTTTNVWFQLFLVDTAQPITKVTLNQNGDIDDLIKAVKTYCKDILSTNDVEQLHAYPPETKVPIGDQDQALAPGENVVNQNWGCKSEPYVIVANSYYSAREIELKRELEREKRKTEEREKEEKERREKEDLQNLMDWLCCCLWCWLQ